MSTLGSTTSWKGKTQNLRVWSASKRLASSPPGYGYGYGYSHGYDYF